METGTISRADPEASAEAAEVVLAASAEVILAVEVQVGAGSPMRLKKRLFLIIFIKLFVLFVILRLIFFPNFLKSKFSSDKDRGDYVREELINR